MRQKSKEVALLAISLLMLASCNEKISAELQSGSTVTPPTVLPTNFNFKVTEISNPNLGFSLHKTGQGNKNASCEINKDTSAFSNDDFLGNQVAYDITCYMDAEELALYNSGMKFKIDASPDSCQFVGYQPYSFFNRMPGDSTANFRVVTCEAGVGDADAASYGAPYGASSFGVCDDFVDTTVTQPPTVTPIVTVANKRPVRVDDDAELCRFNYQEEKCDTGIITIQEVNLALVEGVLSPTTSVRQVTCGGAVANCIQGPIKMETLLSGKTKGEIVTEIEKGQPYTGEKVYPGMILEQRNSNIEYVNYRRFLASPVINFWNSAIPDYIPGEFLTTTPTDYAFNPDLNSRYSSNRSMDGTAYNMLNPANVRATASLAAGYATRPLAAEPFVGFHDLSTSTPLNQRYDHRINPFYTFSCLDNAYETTARIRIMVRDWDRIFDKNADYMELLSDTDYGTSARQDRAFLSGDPINFNNMEDWDDLVPMRRRTGAYNPSLTWWVPYNPIFQRSDTGALENWNFPGDI